MARANGTTAVGGEGVPEGLMASPETRRRDVKGEMIARMRDLPETAQRANETFVGFVREQPLVALGAACAVGYVLGRVLRKVF